MPTYEIRVEKLLGGNRDDRPAFDSDFNRVRFLPAFLIDPATEDNPTGLRVSNTEISAASNDQGASSQLGFQVEGLDPADVVQIVSGGIVHVRAGYTDGTGPPVGPVFYGHISSLDYTTTAGKDVYSFQCLAGTNDYYGTTVQLAATQGIIIGDAIRLVAQAAGLTAGLIPPAAFGDFSDLPTQREVVSTADAKGHANTVVILDGRAKTLLDSLVSDLRRAAHDATGIWRNYSIAYSTANPLLFDVVDADARPGGEAAMVLDVRSPEVISAGGPIYTAPTEVAPAEPGTSDGGEADADASEVEPETSSTVNEKAYTIVMRFTPEAKIGLAVKAVDQLLGITTVFRISSLKHDLVKWRTEIGGAVIRSTLRLGGSGPTGAESIV
jgi:hypothetical protein